MERLTLHECLEQYLEDHVDTDGMIHCPKEYIVGIIQAFGAQVMTEMYLKLDLCRTDELQIEKVMIELRLEL